MLLDSRLVVARYPNCEISTGSGWLFKGDDIFVHASGIEHGLIKEGNLVTYEITQTQKGLAAVNVKIQ